MLIIEESSINSEDARALLHKLNLVLESITGSSGEGSFNTSEFCEEAGHKNNFFLIARLNGEPIACGAIRKMTKDVAEMKRVYADINNVGAARQLVKTLEEKAVKYGYREIWVETRKVNTHAVDFYQSIGYSIMENYGKYAGRNEAVCLKKRIKEIKI